MSEEIQKITNVEYTLTDEVIARKWATVGGKRRQLLNLSDWTQLADCNLSPAVRHYWKVWRQKVRNITRNTVTHPDDALQLLKTLETQSPAALNYDEFPEIEPSQDEITIEKINQLLDARISEIIPQFTSANDVTTLLDEKLRDFKQSMQPKPVELDNGIHLAKMQLMDIIDRKFYEFRPSAQIQHVHTELFNEAVNFKVNMLGNYPLLKIWARNYSKSLTEMADIAISQKKTWLKSTCLAEEERLGWIKKVENATVVDELKLLLHDFLKVQ